MFAIENTVWVVPSIDFICSLLGVGKHNNIRVPSLTQKLLQATAGSHKCHMSPELQNVVVRAKCREIKAVTENDPLLYLWERETYKVSQMLLKYPAFVSQHATMWGLVVLWSSFKSEREISNWFPSSHELKATTTLTENLFLISHDQLNTGWGMKGYPYSYTAKEELRC